MTQFESKIAGIPCIVDVDLYYPGTNYHIDSSSSQPNDPAEFSYSILDRRGYKADWLERKMDDNDDDRIFTEFLELTR